MVKPSDWDECEAYAFELITMNEKVLKEVTDEIVPLHMQDQLGAASNDVRSRLVDAASRDDNSFTVCERDNPSFTTQLWIATHAQRILIGIADGRTKTCQHIFPGPITMIFARVDQRWVTCLECVPKFDRYFPATKRQNFTCDHCWEYCPGDVDLTLIQYGPMTLGTGLCTPCKKIVNAG